MRVLPRSVKCDCPLSFRASSPIPTLFRCVLGRQPKHGGRLSLRSIKWKLSLRFYTTQLRSASVIRTRKPFVALTPVYL
ncbi:unnamed protein product [Chondrus crispus]|uniref:Uncharacterized protein n=1 Tax=Chondrus crispus TaxID=2769 RepID=R7QHN4_CHOCR|nr:unnamed protein product [Chondrus crispus]CDF36935.1 unnamed protein product [Chondrus crispus]|eukprot:XP_005716754.1 unnamed protein product [Chondrus crispus]